MTPTQKIRTEVSRWINALFTETNQWGHRKIANPIAIKNVSGNVATHEFRIKLRPQTWLFEWKRKEKGAKWFTRTKGKYKDAKPGIFYKFAAIAGHRGIISNIGAKDDMTDGEFVAIVLPKYKELKAAWSEEQLTD